MEKRSSGAQKKTVVAIQHGAQSNGKDITPKIVKSYAASAWSTIGEITMMSWRQIAIAVRRGSFSVKQWRSSCVREKDLWKLPL